MHVLVLEGERGASAAAESELRAAGHEVSRCHDPDAPTVPCAGMVEGGSCPLDGEVDVALVVHDSESPRLAGGEDGARCALRHHVPLVVRGDIRRSEYLEWATVADAADVPLVEALERATYAPLRRHASVARRSLRELLETHGLEAQDADAIVRRVGADLRVTLTCGTPLDRRLTEMAAVRAAGAVRSLDTYARVIDVDFEPA